MDNVIDLKTKTKSEIKSESSIDIKRKEAIKKLSQYRGEVRSKNSIRKLPDVAVGEIFWVEMDNKAFIVSRKDKKIMEIKPLDENASISTGLTIFEMNKSLVEKESLLDWESEIGLTTKEKILEWFNKKTNDEYYMLYGKDIHYITLFQFKNREKENSNIKESLLNALENVGNVISMDFYSECPEKSIEIWIRTNTSKAELLYLFPYDKGLIII